LSVDKNTVAVGSVDRVSVTPFDRHYRVPSAARRTIRAFLAVCALVGVLALTDNEGSISTALIGIVYYSVLALILVWEELALPRAGMYESDEGIRVVQALPWRGELLRWDLIASFEQSRTWPRSRVLVLGNNGARVPVAGTAQGSRIVWDGGETRDIVATLTERLEAWRTVHGGNLAVPPRPTR
jgi:hypothetical protein